MPMVQYVNKVEDVRITKTMGTPARIDQLKYWYRAAQKIIPELPKLGAETHYIEHEHADTEYVKFELRSREGVKSQLIIMRNYGKDSVQGR